MTGRRLEDARRQLRQMGRADRRGEVEATWRRIVGVLEHGTDEEQPRLRAITEQVVADLRRERRP
jgi:hypothetical protein